MPALIETGTGSSPDVTSAAIRELGFEPAAEATDYTVEGVIAAVMQLAQR